MPCKLYEGMAKGVLSPLETASRGPEQPLGVQNSPESTPTLYNLQFGKLTAESGQYERTFITCKLYEGKFP